MAQDDPIEEARRALDEHRAQRGDDEQLGELSERLRSAEEQDDEGRSGLAGALQDAVRRFEVEHPDLARALGNAAYRLSGEGL